MPSLVVPSFPPYMPPPSTSFIPPSLLLLLELKYSILITRPKLLPEMKPILWQICNMQIDFIDNLEALLTDFSRFVLTHDSNVQIESSSKVWEISKDAILNIAHCDDLNLIMLHVVQQHTKMCCWTNIFSLG